jgi:hypothetical protein
MEDPEPLSLYLGCLHERKKITLPDGRTVTVVQYNMEQYCDAIVDKYIKLAEEATGKPVKLKKALTPFLPEDHRMAPAAMPASTGPAVECPWCKHTFPCPKTKCTTSPAASTPLDDRGTMLNAVIDSSHGSGKEVDIDCVSTQAVHSSDYGAGKRPLIDLTSKSKKKKNKATVPTAGNKTAAEVDEPRGQLGSVASSILMKTLYCARMARFDFMRAVNRLACFVSKWTEECDRRLYRLICYIHSTKHWRMHGWCGDDPTDISPHVYADADLAGCERSQKSTTGVHLNMEGPTTRFPQVAVSKRQGSVAYCTPEAEAVAGHHAYYKVLVPALDLWQFIMPQHARAIFHEDNTAFIRIIETGRNPTMRHLGRVHRVDIAALHERLGNRATKDAVDVIYTDSTIMAADLYTKAFPEVDKWERAAALINVFDPAHLTEYILSGGPIALPRKNRGEPTPDGLAES